MLLYITHASRVSRRIAMAAQQFACLVNILRIACQIRQGPQDLSSPRVRPHKVGSVLRGLVPSAMTSFNRKCCWPPPTSFRKSLSECQEPNVVAAHELSRVARPVSPNCHDGGPSDQILLGVPLRHLSQSPIPDLGLESASVDYTERTKQPAASCARRQVAEVSLRMRHRCS